MLAAGQRILLCVGFLAAIAGPALSLNEFDFNPGQTCASVAGSLPLHEFYATIKSNLPGGDLLSITFRPHTPSDWDTQCCQTRTNICFTEDSEFIVPEGIIDTLRFDFAMPPGSVGTGWINIRIARFDDPTVWVEATYALGHGVTLPQSKFTFTIDSAFQQANPGELVEFLPELSSSNAFPDSLYCVLDLDVPAGWFAEVCHVETNICIYEEGFIPLGAYVQNDILRVDILTSEVPGVGVVRVRLQSQANPAIWTAIPFRVRTGNIPSAVDDPIPGEGIAVHAVPNPLRDATDLRVLLDRPSRLNLRIVDSGGRLVRSRTTGTLPQGIHLLCWDGTDDQGHSLPNGVYFYRIEDGAQYIQGKLTVNR